MTLLIFFFFFKQKTAYEMRISDWSSDVCSSDLLHREIRARQERQGRTVRRRHARRHDRGAVGEGARPEILLTDQGQAGLVRGQDGGRAGRQRKARRVPAGTPERIDRKSYVQGKSVSVRVNLGGRRIFNKKQTQQKNRN